MYILDTNVLIHDPQAIFSFADAVIIIPMIVLEELDQFKTDNFQRGRSVRAVIRSLDALRLQGSLRDGVQLENGSILRIVVGDSSQACMQTLPAHIPDNYIIGVAVCLQQSGFDVVLVSKDLNVRVKADVAGVIAQDYTKDDVSVDHFYKGWITLPVPAVQLKKQIPQDLIAFTETYQFSPNEYAMVVSQHNPHIYKLFRYIEGQKFKQVVPPALHWGIEARNVQQLIALDLLFDESIQFVALLGPAGTGKTFLTLVAALHKLLVDHAYTKVLISRPVIPLGQDIGYLPGTLEEKLHSWMQPIYDNMEFIVHLANRSQAAIAYGEEDQHQMHDEGQDRYKKYQKQQRQQSKRHSFPSLDELVHRNKISLEAITYMRGRSIPNQFIFIDEVQNLTPHEVKTILSRVGEGSKIVLTGDPYQIDSPYLDFLSNGLMVASQRFKGQKIFGTAFLEISERSELSKLAADLL